MPASVVLAACATENERSEHRACSIKRLDGAVDTYTDTSVRKDLQETSQPLEKNW